MPTTVRETLLAAAAAKLAAISGISGLSVERNRRDDVSAFPMLVMRDGGERIAERLVVVDRRAIAFDVECYVEADTGAAAGAALDVLLGASEAALLADVTLGVGAFDVRVVDVGEPIFDVSDVAQLQASVVVRYEVEAWCAPDDPYSLAP